MSHECPTCDRNDFDTERAMKVHHSRAHGESLKESTTCGECGDEFVIEDPTKPNNYCSRECVHRSKRDRVTLTCDHCNDEFDVPKSASHYNYCSLDCRHASSSSLTECEMCGRRFRSEDSKPRKYCCETCYAEVRCERPRPDDLDSMLWLLYVYEGYGVVETYKRQRAVLGFDSCLTKDDVRDRLDEMGVMRDYNAARWTLQKMEADQVGESTPEGDDSWKQLYSTG